MIAVNHFPAPFSFFGNGEWKMGCSSTHSRGSTNFCQVSTDDLKDNWSWRSHAKTPFSGGLGNR